MTEKIEQKTKKNAWKRGLVFSLILLFLLGICQRILIPKKPGFPESKMSEYFSLRKKGADIQVLTIGSSHMMHGFSPIELYKNEKILSYNLATTGSSFSLSYFLLKEALKTQKPKVVVFDVGMFFAGKESSYIYNILIDEFPFSRNKISMAYKLTNIEGKNFNNTFWGVFFPLNKYHSRWKELNYDFFYPKSGKNSDFFNLGYHIDTCMIASTTTPEEINNFAYAMNGYAYNYTLDFEDGLEEYVKAMKVLCQQNGVELLATKIPTNRNPINYGGSWTREKYEKVKEFCDEQGITFIDMQYDLNVGLDWRYDTCDGGAHVNYLAAKKLTKILGDYLLKHYDLTPQRNAHYDYCASVYDKVAYASDLELTHTLPEYVEKLKTTHKNSTVILAAMEDLISGITQEEKKALASLGLTTLFDASIFVNSYIAVIKNGIVEYENVQKTRQKYEFELDDGRKVEILSSGWYSESAVEIKIDGKDQTLKHKGLHILVIDNESGLVLDSVCFDTNDPNNFDAIRPNNLIYGYYPKYKAYIIDKEGRK